MAENKVNYGLCKLAYAIITETAGVISYGTPVMLPGAVNFTAAPSGEEVEFEADNIIYYRSQGNYGYDVTLEIMNVPDAFLKDVMGETLDTNNVAVESADDVVKRIAVLGQFEGDVHKKRFVLYNCLPKRGNFDGSTSRKKEPKPRTITLAADPRPDGVIKASTTGEVNATAYNGWFESVYEPAASAGA